ncbi:MAG TPA: hypothetical protein VKR43_09245, partial [Bryobacteraceae bacterium]|nr:hypothetical protein [Bryobacteraceae bacterium]
YNIVTSSPAGSLAGGIGDVANDVTHGALWYNATGGPSGWINIAAGASYWFSPTAGQIETTNVVGIGTPPAGGYGLTVGGNALFTQVDITGLTASTPVRSNAGNRLISGQIDLSTADITGALDLTSSHVTNNLPTTKGGSGGSYASLAALGAAILAAAGGASGNFQAFQTTVTGSITYVSGGITAPSGGGLCSWSSGSATFVTLVTTITVNFSTGLIT